MQFLTPAALALSALIPIIVAMYLLKLRRTEQVVSSVYLWRRMVRDLEANAPWQRLRRNLLLLLQLLFVATLILALARPFTWAQGASGQALTLILDSSASMAATDVPSSRLEAAKAQARQLIDGQPDDARVTIINAGDGAQVLVASSQDRRQIHQALDRVKPGAGGSDLTAALELASAIAARQAEAKIIVLSDGQVSLPERLALKGQVSYLPVGLSGDNQAISTLSLETAPGDGNMTAFAQVTNYGDAPARRRLALYADGQLVNAFDLEIAPGDRQAVIAGDLPPVTTILEAQLTGQDVLPLDDRAWAVQRRIASTPVTLVTDGNLFLETGLSLLPGLEVTTVKPSDFEEEWKEKKEENGETGRLKDGRTDLPGSQASNLTIFDSYVPITATLPAGNLLFIAPARSTKYFTVTGKVERPLPRPVDSEDQLLAHVNLAEVGVLDATQLQLPPWARPVIAGDAAGESTPLLFAGEIDGRRVAVLAFDLHRSDLPLQVAFPLLLANLSGWLAPGGGDLPTQVLPGTALTLALPPDVESATVTRPDGSTARLIPEAGRAAFADTGQLGLYELNWHSPALLEEEEANRAYFAVNLFSPQESNVRPVKALPVLSEGAMGEDEHLAAARREWWRLLALSALALLIAEWLVYQRATLARLWGKTRRMMRRTQNVTR